MQVFIDLDGTILDFFERYYALLSDFFKTAPVSKFVYIEKRKSGLSEKDLLIENEIPIRNIEQYLEFRRINIEDKKYLDFDTPFDLSSLVECKQKHSITLLTNRHNKSNLVYQLRKMNIIHFFDNILTPENRFESAGAFKEFYLKASAANCIMIGDTKADIISAKKCNVYSVGVLSGLNNQQKMSELNPTIIINDISEISTVFKTIAK